MYKTIVGDATKPAMLGQVPIVIPHVCNDVEGGAWGRGFVIAISKAFGMIPKQAYHSWAKGEGFVGHKTIKVTGTYGLGNTQLVKIHDKHLVIANMVSQRGLGFTEDGRPPLRYAALAACMIYVANVAEVEKAEIHCPKFGSDLSGGDWNVISLLIQELWTDNGISVTVYEFPKP